MKTKRFIQVFRVALIVVLGLAVSSPLDVQGQNVESSMGTEFWLMFLDNYDISELSLTASCPDTTTVEVEIPQMNWDTTLVVNRGCAEIPIPYSYGHSATAPDTGKSGIHVVATSPITLYASNYMSATFDMTLVLPERLLGKHYIVQTYREYGKDEIGIVATEDNTWVYFDIFIDDAYRLARGSYAMHLMKGETYQIKSSSDLSGTEILSSKPVAVFQGSECTKVGGCTACDHIYEQSMPVEYWGRQFLLVPTKSRDAGDMIKVTSSANGCQLAIDDVTLDTVLDMGDSYTFELPHNSVKSLTSTKPVSVGIYLKGKMCCQSGRNGDPSSVMLPPVEQGITEVLFEAVNTERTEHHYVNIVTPTECVYGMTFDGDIIRQHFTPHRSGYSYAQLEISDSSHVVSNFMGTFIVWFYGLGGFESYAYIAGTAFRDLSRNIFVDGVMARTHPSPFVYCQGDTALLTYKVNDSLLLTYWLIDSVFEYYGDMGYSWHATEPGLHFVQATSGAADTLSTWIYVNPSSNDTLVDTICEDLSRYWYGHLYDSTGMYADTLQRAGTGCDSIKTLDLTVVPKPTVSVDSSVDCETGLFTLFPDFGEAVGLPFVWTSSAPDTLLMGHEHDTMPQVFPEDITVYTVEVEHPFCHVEGSLRLEPFSKPNAVLVVEPERLDYDRPNFDAYDRSQTPDWRQWYVDNELMSVTGPHLNHFVSPSADSAVVELVIGIGNCNDTARRTVSFSHTAIWAPDVFTPGADRNNLFFISHAECELLELYIYDRQGRLMSHIEGPDPQWDGTTDGRPCPQAAYVWLVRYIRPDFPGGVQSAHGIVTLLR